MVLKVPVLNHFLLALVLLAEFMVFYGVESEEGADNVMNTFGL